MAEIIRFHFVTHDSGQLASQHRFHLRSTARLHLVTFGERVRGDKRQMRHPGRRLTDDLHCQNAAHRHPAKGKTFGRIPQNPRRKLGHVRRRDQQRHANPHPVLQRLDLGREQSAIAHHAGEQDQIAHIRPRGYRRELASAAPSASAASLA